MKKKINKSKKSTETNKSKKNKLDTIAKSIAKSIPGEKDLTKTYDNILKIHEIKKIDKTPDNELNRDIIILVDNLLLGHLNGKSEKELKLEIIKYVKNYQIIKEFECFIIFPDIGHLPIGIKIGELEIIDPPKKYFTNSSKVIPDFFNYFQKDALNNNKNSWGKLTFKSNNVFIIEDIIHDKLELPYAIISLFTHHDLEPKETIGLLYERTSSRINILKPKKRLFWSGYQKEKYDNYIKVLSQITQKSSRTSLEKKILQAIQTYWFSKLSKRIEIRFLLVISAFESLLLSRNDLNYLGKRLAEKVAFLCSQNFDERMKLYIKIKRFYDIRSKIVHSGSSNIVPNDEIEARKLFQKTTFELLKLTNKYPKMERKNPKNDKEPEGVEDFFNKLRFSN